MLSSPAATKGAENWACLASLIETCKLNGVDPQAYLTDVLTKLVNNWPNSHLAELLPWLGLPKRADPQVFPVFGREIVECRAGDPSPGTRRPYRISARKPR